MAKIDVAVLLVLALAECSVSNSIGVLLPRVFVPISTENFRFLVDFFSALLLSKVYLFVTVEAIFMDKRGDAEYFLTTEFVVTFVEAASVLRFNVAIVDDFSVNDGFKCSILLFLETILTHLPPGFPVAVGIGPLFPGVDVIPEVSDPVPDKNLVLTPIPADDNTATFIGRFFVAAAAISPFLLLKTMPSRIDDTDGDKKVAASEIFLTDFCPTTVSC